MDARLVDVQNGAVHTGSVRGSIRLQLDSRFAGSVSTIACEIEEWIKHTITMCHQHHHDRLGGNEKRCTTVHVHRTYKRH